MQAKVEAELILAKSRIDHLNSITFGDFIDGKGTVWSPRVTSSVWSLLDNCSSYNTVAWAAAEEDKTDGGAHVDIIPSNVVWCPNCWVREGVWSKNRIIRELSLFIGDTSK